MSATDTVSPRRRADAGAPRSIAPVVGRGLTMLRSPTAARLMIAVAAVAVHLSGVSGGYVFDDHWVIVENSLVQQASVREILTGTYTPGPVYRPLTLLTFAINERLGVNPLADHLWNVALHAVVALLVYSLARRMMRSRAGALLAGLLFAVHPIHSEAVANLVGRAELLAAALAMTTLVAYARGLESARQRWPWFALSLTSYAMAPFAKESALTVLPLLPLLYRRQHPTAPWQQLLRITCAFAAAAVPYLAMRWLLTGALTYPTLFPMLDNPLAHLPPSQRIASALVILGEYVGLLVAPITLSADYSYDQVPVVTSLADGRLWLALALFAGAAGILWSMRRRSAPLLFCAAFAACTLSLTANLFFPIGTIKAERLLYLPSVAWCLAAGWLAARAARRQPRAVAAGACLVLALYGARTWARGRDWRDDATLYEATARAVPNSAKAQYNYGTVLLDRGAIDDAVVQFRRALQIDPRYHQAAFGLGKAYEFKGIASGALYWYGHATRIEWEFPNAHLQTGLIRKQLGEFAAAEAAFRTGLGQRPDHPFLLLALGAVRIEQGDRWEAAELVNAYDALEWTQPRYRDAYAATRLSIVEALNS